MYSYSGMALSAGTVLADWDEQGPDLYYVDSEGGGLKGTKFSVRYSFDLSDEEAAELANAQEWCERQRYMLVHVDEKAIKVMMLENFHYKHNPVKPMTMEQEMAEA